MLKHMDRVTAGIIGGAILLIIVVIAVGVGVLGGSDEPISDAAAATASTAASSATSTSTTTSTTTPDEEAESPNTTGAAAELPTTTGPLPELPKLDDQVRDPTVSFLEAGVPLAERVDAGALSVASSGDPCDRPDSPAATDVVNEVAATPDGVLGELWQAQGADLALLEAQCQDDGRPDPDLVTTIVTRAQLIQARKDQL